MASYHTGCIAVAVAVFAAVKSYPVDYNEAGELLVDGAKMANDTYKGVGWCVGFLIGWILIHFYIVNKTFLTHPGIVEVANNL